MRSNWRLAAVAALSFVLGYFAHRHRALEPLRALTAYATGRGGGCSLAALIQARSRMDRLNRALNDALDDVKLVETSPDGYSRWETPLGPLWCPPKNTPAFAVGEQVAEVYTEGPMALAAEDVVLDCGANIGDFVRICLQAGVAKVVAIDPSPGNVEAMRRSFAREIAAGRVVVVPKGVWHEETQLRMTLYENTLLDSFVMGHRPENRGGQPREVSLPVTTIDKIVEDLRLEKVTFLKMDIEGAERNAIRGAVQTIRRFRPRMAVATENLDDDYLVVPQEVRRLGQKYRVQCGLCRLQGPVRYRPDILFFLPE
jgi:FkbM family methyltransferase